MPNGDTDKILAAKYPNVPRSWLEKVNERLGRFASCIIAAKFVDNREIWTDCTERTFGDSAHDNKKVERD